MQDDLIAKSQQVVPQKFTYSKKQYDNFPQDPSYKNPNQPKSKQKKKSNSNASGLLGFKVDHKEHIVSRISKPTQKMLSDITLSPYYRYSVIPGNYHIYHSDPSKPLDWDIIKKVHVLADSESKCPICLENSLLVARANKCGHYYCWPCIIRYLWLAQGTKKCPVCNDSLRAVDLRPVSLHTYQNVSENMLAEFSLMKRPKGTISIFRANDPNEPTQDSFLSSASPSSYFNKISIYTNAKQDLIEDKQNLISAMASADDFEKTSIQRALDLLDKYNSESLPYTEFVHNPFSCGFYYFYQLSDTQPYFLHPINVSMLKKEFSDFELFPPVLTRKIIEIERVYVTEQDQRRYGQLAHLAKNAIAYFVEIDMKGLCSNAVLEYYKEELVKRAKARQKYKRIENKIQAQISRRRKGEEEANNLLNSYFENPVVAPVMTLPPKTEIKQVPVEEEVKTESKSIWSNFSEVLKRPPREKPKTNAQTDPEKKEDDEVGPKKLTLFDLIKPRNNS